MNALEDKETQTPTNKQTQGATLNWISALQSPHFQAVEQRVLRQLIQALVFEGVLPYEEEHQKAGESSLIFTGETPNRQPVCYSCSGQFKHSFGLLRLNRKPVMRTMAGEVATPASLTDFAGEILSRIPAGDRLPEFIEELEQTLLKDVQAQASAHPTTEVDPFDYDALEHRVMEAHSYHPCYKSRLGFSLADNQRYGPEFNQPLALQWVAIHRDIARMNASERIDYPAYIRHILGDTEYEHFHNILEQQNKSIDDYWLMPVHPWQWDEKVATLFHSELASEDLIWLGQGHSDYRAQQSIRTLSNARHNKKPYAKLALGITNTSTSRILAAHTVLNGPVITDWLQGLIQWDETARGLDFVILGEVLGVTCDYQSLPEARRMRSYGNLGVIWRESLHKYLRVGEAAVPFNGLSHQLANSAPLINDWIEQFGVRAWTQQLLRVTVTPIIHMLFAHGIGMESHGQNIVLIHRYGWPQRIALKDFHDGVRFSPEHLAEPDHCPELYPAPASHARINRNSFILTDDLDAVRDFSCDAFFFICLSDLCLFLEENYQLSEATFWSMTAQIIQDYQAGHPQHRERFRLFNVFAETFQVEELTKRRLLGDGEPRLKDVKNPLYTFQPVNS